MRLTIPQPQLADLLGAVAKTAIPRATISIGATVLLDASEGSLRATCTDFDMAVSASAPAEISAPGKCCPQAATLAQFVKGLPKDRAVEMELDGDRLTIRCGRARATLPCLSPEDFPLRRLSGEEHHFALPGKDLSAALASTGFAASTEETRHYLCGIHMAVREGALFFSATDGHRGAVLHLPLPEGAAEMPAIIIPRAVIGPLADLAGAGESIALTVTETGLSASAAGRSLITKLVDGTFPDIERVIPREVERPALIDAAAARAAIQRVSAVADDVGSGPRGHIVKLAFNGALTISGGAADRGDAEEVIDCTDAPEMEIGFNGKHLGEVLAIGAETIEMHMTDPSYPVLLRDPARPELRVVIMPLRV